MVSFVVLCAGNSERLGISGNKTLLPVLGRPLFLLSLELFKKYSDDVIVVCKEEEKLIFEEYHDNIVIGGKTRAESVYNGVKQAKYEKVFVHDGARPNITDEDVYNLIEVSRVKDLAFLGSVLFDSLKDNNYNNLCRENYYLAYTPQYVLKEDYLKAYQIAKEKGIETTDDVSLIKETLGKEITFVQGRKDNLKVTTYSDYLLLKENLERTFRIGHSLDIHELVEGRKLILGGIEIPYEKGLLGHSDADCVLHAISEAILGACGLNDLGYYYPDNSPKTLGMDSKIILNGCKELMLNKGFVIGNIDVMIYAQNPKLAPYISAMKETICNVLDIHISQLSIKATTTEKLGVIGEGKAIASEASVLVYKKDC